MAPVYIVVTPSMAITPTFGYSPSIHHLPTTTSTHAAPFQSKPTTLLSVSHPSDSHLQALHSDTPLTNANTISISIRNRNLMLYLEHSKYFTTSLDGGPPRWFSPLDSCSSRLPNPPLLLYLPGILGTGLGLSVHHPRLGEMFDIWCLHIPATDRTPFPELVQLVESTVKSENCQFPERPIYLVGQSFGACLALAVAARNPGIDILLVLANSATSFNSSRLHSLIPLLEAMPKELGAGLRHMLNLMTGTSSIVVAEALEKWPSQQTDTETEIVAMFSDLPGLAEVLSVEALLWKLRLLDSACSYTNSRLHAVKVETLILSSGRDQLLPSQQEGERLYRLLPNSDVRTFDDSGHLLFMEQEHDLVTILKSTSFYRRTRHLDYVLDYLPPTRDELRKARESHSRSVEEAFSPVMLSTLENGKIVRGLSGIPSEGPVLLVGNHMLRGLELAPLIAQFAFERGILLRGMAHPMTFKRLKKGRLADMSSEFDKFRLMGAVPVSATNLFKLLKLKAHILLYPGGLREALHRKGEEYKLFWPEQSEFVRMAARFGAKIVPFGAVGEDDIGELIWDYEDQMKIPYMRRYIQEVTDETVQLRGDTEGEMGMEDVHFPVACPKLPGRFYFLFGKPIETQGRQEELRNKEKAHEVYVEVKSEVESCLGYLKEKRQNDRYRSILSRYVYQLLHGLEREIPTFEL